MSKSVHKKAVEADVARIRAKVLRSIKKRLRILERNAGVMFVSFRLNVHPNHVHEMLYGDRKLTLEQMSDLALAVGCKLKPQLKRGPASTK